MLLIESGLSQSYVVPRCSIGSTIRFISVSMRVQFPLLVLSISTLPLEILMKHTIVFDVVDLKEMVQAHLEKMALKIVNSRMSQHDCDSGEEIICRDNLFFEVEVEPAEEKDKGSTNEIINTLNEITQEAHINFLDKKDYGYGRQ